MKIKQWLFFLILVPQFAWADAPNWDLYDSLLSEYVTPGTKDGVKLNMVDYEGLQTDPMWPVLVGQVRAMDVKDLKTKKQRMAFYINAYNILTIQLIMDHWPVKSIKDIGNLLVGPWDITMMDNFDGKLTLDDIEHQILRPMGDPRIHFAINCASVSCPDLRREAYRADKLDAQLDDQTKKFLSNPAKGLVVKSDGKAHMSKLFKWYADDFDVNGIQAFIHKYRPDVDMMGVSTNLPYDWLLNGKVPPDAK